MHFLAGDFPDLREMQDKLLTHDFTKFRELKKPLLDAVDKMLAEDIARLMAKIPHVSENLMALLVNDGAFSTAVSGVRVTDRCFLPRCLALQEQIEQKKDETIVKGGAFDVPEQSPFAHGRGEGIDAGSLEKEWVP